MDFKPEYGHVAPPDATPGYHSYMNDAGERMGSVHPVIRHDAWEPISNSYLEWEREDDRVKFNLDHGDPEARANENAPGGLRDHLNAIRRTRDEKVAEVIQAAHDRNQREGLALAEKERDESVAHKLRVMQRQRMRQRDDGRDR